MTVADGSQVAAPSFRASKPRFGGALWRAARFTSALTLPLAGKPWNPIFAVVEHRGRKSGRNYLTPIAARRVPGGFVISLAFGAQVDWHRNLLTAGGGTIVWRGLAHRVGSPVRVDLATALPAFNLIQRVMLRLTGVDGYVRVEDVDVHSR